MKFYSSKLSKDIKNQIQNNLLKQGISFSEKFTETMKITFKDESVNKEVMVLYLEWGNFSMEVKVLNNIESNSKHIGFI